MTNIEDNNMSLVHAAATGNAVAVKRLIPVSNPTARFNSALVMAAHEGHSECVKLLIPVSDPTFYTSYSPLKWAVKEGHIECVRLLIPAMEEDLILDILWQAAQFNHIDCVALLVGACNPKDNKSRALQLAIEHNSEECLEFLYDLCDPIAALKQLKENYPDHPEKWSALENFEAERLRTVLSNEVGEGTPDRKHKM